MKGRLRELTALPVAELALMKACVVPVLRVPTAATRVKTALAEPPAGTAMVCEVPGVTGTAPAKKGLEKNTLTEPAKLLMEVTVTVTVFWVVPSGGRTMGVIWVLFGVTLRLNAPLMFRVHVVVALTPPETPLTRMG